MAPFANSREDWSNYTPRSRASLAAHMWSKTTTKPEIWNSHKIVRWVKISFRTTALWRPLRCAPRGRLKWLTTWLPARAPVPGSRGSLPRMNGHKYNLRWCAKGTGHSLGAVINFLNVFIQSLLLWKDLLCGCYHVFRGCVVWLLSTDHRIVMMIGLLIL